MMSAIGTTPHLFHQTSNAYFPQPLAVTFQKQYLVNIAVLLLGFLILYFSGWLWPLVRFIATMCFLAGLCCTVYFGYRWYIDKGFKSDRGARDLIAASAATISSLVVLFFLSKSITATPVKDARGQSTLPQSVLAFIPKDKTEKTGLTLDWKENLQSIKHKIGLENRLSAEENANLEEAFKLIAKVPLSSKEKEQLAAEYLDILRSAVRLNEAEEAWTGLEKIVIQRPRFYFLKTRFSSEPTIEFTINNSSKHTISRAYFRVGLVSAGRAVPWAESEFGIPISGGLEPGESKECKLDARTLSGNWASVPKDRTYRRLTVSTRQIDGANGEPILSVGPYQPPADALKDIAELRKRLRTWANELINSLKQ